MLPFSLIDRPSPFHAADRKSLPVFAVTPQQLEAGSIDPVALDWARKADFKAEAGALLLVPTADGRLGGALFGLGAAITDTPFITGKLAKLLPGGHWHIETAPIDHGQLALGFGLGAYRFERYKTAKAPDTTLTLPRDVDAAEIRRLVAGTYLVRDLINTPANDMGPAALEAAFRALAAHEGAEVQVIAGDALLERNFPLIHAVGRAAAEAPRLLELRWGKGKRRITLVGKGVTFDTGGLDIKPAASMALMKKDMGGAAHVMALAAMIMNAKLKVELRVMVPVVENAISASAFRPGDIYRSRKGLTVQIDNTDAEGRLILADALAYADEEKADLLIDMATLTGAARVALGPDIAPFYTDSDPLAEALMAASQATTDPLWRMPLFKGYEKDVAARIADLTNAPSGGMAGSITAALFLKRFVEQAAEWAHFDIYGWAAQDRPHGPQGGEAQAIRALYHLIAKG